VIILVSGEIKPALDYYWPRDRSYPALVDLTPGLAASEAVRVTERTIADTDVQSRLLHGGAVWLVARWSEAPATLYLGTDLSHAYAVQGWQWESNNGSILVRRITVRRP
jgi:hypothetical protein